MIQCHLVPRHSFNHPYPLEQDESRDIRPIYQDRYAGEKLVKVVGEAPLVRLIQNKHHVEIGALAVDSTGKRVVV
jgi:N-acetyl-gamma-glutamylphosphate reductase